MNRWKIVLNKYHHKLNLQKTEVLGGGTNEKINRRITKCSHLYRKSEIIVIVEVNKINKLRSCGHVMSRRDVLL